MAPTAEQTRRLKVDKLSAKKKLQPKARVQRYLKSIESQLVERFKSTLLFKGIQCSQTMSNVLKELKALQAPHAKLLNKKNQISPFEESESVEFLVAKNDCALFAVASSNKKRPNNLILGRTFDRQVLDLCELGLIRFKSAMFNGDYPGSVAKKRIGSKPMLLFCGDLWQQHNRDSGPQLQNLLTDFYRGDVVDKLVFNGLDHIIVFTLVEQQPPEIAGQPQKPVLLLHQRTYFCHLALNNTTQQQDSCPYVPQLENCGPDFDFIVRRTRWAPPDLAKAARLQPRSTSNKKKKKKNQSTNVFGETLGRLHITKQDLQHMGGRKAKALRRAEKLEAQKEKEALENDLKQEQPE